MCHLFFFVVNIKPWILKIYVKLFLKIPLKKEYSTVGRKCIEVWTARRSKTVYVGHIVT
jgi:hypothetical protein